MLPLRRAIYKGVVVGVLILGIAYFWHEQGELYMDVLRHIPQILFEGYQPAAFDPEVQKKFGILEIELQILQMLILIQL